MLSYNKKSSWVTKQSWKKEAFVSSPSVLALNLFWFLSILIDTNVRFW